MRRAAVKTDGDDHYKKFAVGKTPLQQEEKLDVIQPQDSAEAKRYVKLLKKLINDPTKSPAERNAFQVYLANMQADSIKGIIRKEFLRDFIAWYRGTGKEEDHKKTWWYRQSLLMDPEVRAYDEAFLNQRQEYVLQLHLMKNRAPIGIKEIYLYFKYIVRGESLDNVNFLQDRQLFQDDFWKSRKVQDAWQPGKAHEMAPWGDERRKIALRHKQKEENSPVPVVNDSSSDDDDEDRRRGNPPDSESSSDDDKPDTRPSKKQEKEMKQREEEPEEEVMDAAATEAMVMSNTNYIEQQKAELTRLKEEQQHREEEHAEENRKLRERLDRLKQSRPKEKEEEIPEAPEWLDDGLDEDTVEQEPPAEDILERLNKLRDGKKLDEAEVLENDQIEKGLEEFNKTRDEEITKASKVADLQKKLKENAAYSLSEEELDLLLDSGVLDAPTKPVKMARPIPPSEENGRVRTHGLRHQMETQIQDQQKYIEDLEKQQAVLIEAVAKQADRATSNPDNKETAKELAELKEKFEIGRQQFEEQRSNYNKMRAEYVKLLEIAKQREVEYKETLAKAQSGFADDRNRAIAAIEKRSAEELAAALAGAQTDVNAYRNRIQILESELAELKKSANKLG